MEILGTPHKKKSAVLTGIFAIFISLLLYVSGLTYYDPPIRYGMEVNFGNQAQGSGSVQPKNPVSNKPSIVRENQAEENQKVTSKKNITPKKTVDVFTEKKSTVPVTRKQEVVEQIKPNEIASEKPVKITPAKEIPKVSEATKSVVSDLLNYYSTLGFGGRGKSYGLNGRNLQSNGKVVQECNQEGTVVVRITVNSQGNVIAAEPGVKGSTNTHPCLLQPAKQTALSHKWYPDNNAPNEQIGFVVIQFKLGE
ncbi:MAG: energy transducer TonB family protein [Flavobacteriales bacterium]